MPNGHERDNIILTKFLSLVTKMILWVVAVVTVVARWCAKKEGKGTVISEKMLLVLHTYVVDISHVIVCFVSEIFSVGTSILCRHFISESATCLLHFG